MDGRDRMIAACRGEDVDRPPVWLMRQAGRYLPEYRELRARHPFWEMVRTPSLAVEATLQPLRRFPVDAAIIFSDILVVLDAIGADVVFEGSGGPVIRRRFASAEDLERAAHADVRTRIGYLGEAVAELCAAVHPHHAVIGFAGAPLTLAAYWAEGGASKDLRGLKGLFYRSPDLVTGLMDRLADAVADLLILQIEAGADLVQVFDTWAGLLAPDDYAAIAAPAVRRVVDRIGGRVPVLLYLRGAAAHLEAAAGTGADVLSIDASLGLADARRRCPGVGLQGNLDPAWLLAPPDRLRARVRQMVRDAGPSGYIANLGQGLFPECPVEGVEAFVDAIVHP